MQEPPINELFEFRLAKVGNELGIFFDEFFFDEPRVFGLDPLLRGDLPAPVMPMIMFLSLRSRHALVIAARSIVECTKIAAWDALRNKVGE